MPGKAIYVTSNHLNTYFSFVTYIKTVNFQCKSAILEQLEVTKSLRGLRKIVVM